MTSPAPPGLQLDVVICTYNNAAGLDRVLAALGRQTRPATATWTVLVVDNNCTDDTAAVIARHVQTGRLAALRTVAEPEQGLTPARLRGVRETLGSWIAFVDDDCIPADDWIAETANFALQNPSCGAFGGRVILNWEAPQPSYLQRYGWLFAEQDLHCGAREVDWIVGAGMVVNRSAVQDSGWSRLRLLEDRVGSRLVSGGDMEIALRIKSAGYPLWYAPACEMRHAITRNRTEPRYLLPLNRGLGASATLVGSLTWAGSEAGWVAANVRACLQLSRSVVRRLAGFLRGDTERIEVAMDAAFLLGRGLGVWRLAQSRRRRRRLLGRALP